MEKYQDYNTEDFTGDKDFVKWVNNPDDKSDKRWNQFLVDFPNKKEALEQARIIVSSLQPKEDKISKESINSIWDKIEDTKKSINLFRYKQWFQYAAIFILAFVLGGTAYYFINNSQPVSNQYTEISVPYGERSELALPDGTKVWLNSGTKLKFPTVFNNKERKVFISGEALFEVAKNKRKTFIVNTGDVDVMVLGTRFNVEAYKNDDIFKTTLAEGSVRLLNKVNGRAMEIVPGEQFIYHPKTHKSEIKNVDVDLFLSWKDKLLRFDNTNFDDVIRRMERWYNMDITVDKSFRTSKLYTLTIKNETIDEMLHLLSFITPMKYEIKENSVLIMKP